MTLQANFVLNNPALLQKSYDFNSANLVGLNSSGNSQALRMHSQDYRRMLMDKLEQIHAHGDPARYRAYFPKYLLKCLQDHCHYHHETLYRELKHASYSIEEIVKNIQTNC